MLFGPNNCGKSRLLRLLCNAPASIEITWDTMLPHGGDLFKEAHHHAELYGLPPLLFDVKRQDGKLSISSETRVRLEQLRHQMGSRIEALCAEIEGAMQNLGGRIRKPPKAIYIRAHRYLQTTAPIANTDGDPDDPAQMVRVLSRLQNHFESDRRNKFERIQRAFTDISGVSFALRQSDEWTVYIAEGGASGERPLDHCGDGLRDLLGLILRVEEHPRCALFIDEPGVRLHPRAQRALLKYLLQAAQNRPIWLATHDGVFIGSPDVQCRYAISRDGGVTTALRVESSQEILRAFSDLGWSPRDAFLCDTILFCEGTSDRLVFSQLLQDPGHPVFQGVEVVHLGGDRIWGRDSARLKALVNAVKAVAPHARFVALLDRGGHAASECDEVSRLLWANGVDVFWLQNGELESFWISDVAFCVDLCGAVARLVGIEIPAQSIRMAIDAESPAQPTKASVILERVLRRLDVRSSKQQIAEAAAKLMATGQGVHPKAELMAELTRVLRRSGELGD